MGTVNFSDWWRNRFSFRFGTKWLEPLCMPMASAAWDDSAAEQAAPMAARTACLCESSPDGHYTVTAHFATLREAQAAHAWLARLKPPNV
jgi:hypothetical protein